jgi:hypothetical protein
LVGLAFDTCVVLVVGWQLRLKLKLKLELELEMRAGARTQIHDVVSADGAVVDDDVPGPKGDGVPLMMLVFVFAFASASPLLLIVGSSPS